MLEQEIRYQPEEFADAFCEFDETWDASPYVDPAFWGRAPEKYNQNDNEKPF